MNHELTCIGCPMGCLIDVELGEDGSIIKLSGNECPRGDKYARQECTAPMRMVTSLMIADFSHAPVSVKTRTPIPKDIIPQCLEKIRKTHPQLPIAMGDVLISNICDTGIDVIATCNVF